MALVPPSSHSGGLGNVTLSGTAAAGQAPIATSSSAAAWAFPPGYELDYAQITSNVSVTATSEATATTIVTGNAVTYDGSTAVLIQFWTPSFSIPSSAAGTIVLYDGSSSIGFLSGTTATAGGTIDQEVSAWRRITPSAAAHTYSIRAYRATSNCTIQAGAGNTNGVYQPAFIRITRV